MTLRVSGDPERLEQFASQNPDKMRAIVELALAHGLIHHRFWGRDGEILVVDEWESEQGFHTFFEAAASEIRPMMVEAGATGEPEITFRRPLEIGDEV
jgi:hypothetical protein